MAEYINVGYTLSMHRNLRQIICLGIVFAFLANTFGPLPVYAQEFALPPPGQMVELSPAYSPVVLKGIKLDPKNPFRFNFFVDRGDSSLSQEKLKQESSKLIKYFLASLTIPEKDLWVNLSPYEKDRIVPLEFGQTEMGRDLLAEDYLLKQITASLIYPENQLGKEFWNKVYAKAVAKYGTTNIPINTFNKVWIVPEKAVVYENGGVAFVLENHLKVMLEQDYLSLAKHEGIHSMFVQVKDTNQLGSQIVREIVIPALTKEVNEGKNFSQLRQVFYSLILATWYKKKIKGSILNKVYSNQNKIGGVNVSAQDKDRIYQEYLRAFKKGVYNYIKEEPDQITGQTVPRKYFSGGVLGAYLDAAMLYEETGQVSRAQLADLAQISKRVVNVFGDAAMNSSRIFDPEKFVDQFLGQITPYLKEGKSLTSSELSDFDKWGIPANDYFPRDEHGKPIPLTKEEMRQIYETVIEKERPLLTKSNGRSIPKLLSVLYDFFEGHYPYALFNITDLFLYTVPLTEDYLHKLYPNDKVVVLGRDGLALLMKDYFDNPSKYKTYSHTLFYPGFIPKRMEKNPGDKWNAKDLELYTETTIMASQILQQMSPALKTNWNEGAVQVFISRFNSWLLGHPDCSKFLEEIFSKQIQDLLLAKNEHVVLYDTMGSGKSVLIAASILSRLRPDVSVNVFVSYVRTNFHDLHSVYPQGPKGLVGEPDWCFEFSHFDPENHLPVFAIQRPDKILDWLLLIFLAYNRSAIGKDSELFRQVLKGQSRKNLMKFIFGGDSIFWKSKLKVLLFRNKNNAAMTTSGSLGRKNVAIPDGRGVRDGVMNSIKKFSTVDALKEYVLTLQEKFQAFKIIYDGKDFILERTGTMSPHVYSFEYMNRGISPYHDGLAFIANSKPLSDPSDDYVLEGIENFEQHTKQAWREFIKGQRLMVLGYGTYLNEIKYFMKDPVFDQLVAVDMDFKNTFDLIDYWGSLPQEDRMKITVVRDDVQDPKGEIKPVKCIYSHGTLESSAHVDVSKAFTSVDTWLIPGGYLMGRLDEPPYEFGKIFKEVYNDKMFYRLLMKNEAMTTQISTLKDVDVTNKAMVLPAWYIEGSKIQRPFSRGLADIPYKEKISRDDPSLRALLEHIRMVELNNGFPSGTIVITGGAVRNLLGGNGRFSKETSDVDILIRATHGNPYIEDNIRRVWEALGKELGQTGLTSDNTPNILSWNGFLMDYIGYYDSQSLDVHLRGTVAPDNRETISDVWIDTQGNVTDPYGGIKDLLVDKVFRWKLPSEVNLDDVISPRGVLRAIRFKFEFGLEFSDDAKSVVENVFKDKARFKAAHSFWKWLGVLQDAKNCLQNKEWWDSPIWEEVREAIKTTVWFQGQREVLLKRLDSIIFNKKAAEAKIFLDEDFSSPRFRGFMYKIIMWAPTFAEAKKAREYLRFIGFDPIADSVGFNLDTLLNQRPDKAMNVRQVQIDPWIFQVGEIDKLSRVQLAEKILKQSPELAELIREERGRVSYIQKRSNIDIEIGDKPALSINFDRGGVHDWLNHRVYSLEDRYASMPDEFYFEEFLRLQLRDIGTDGRQITMRQILESIGLDTFHPLPLERFMHIYFDKIQFKAHIDPFKPASFDIKLKFYEGRQLKKVIIKEHEVRIGRHDNLRLLCTVDFHPTEDIVPSKGDIDLLAFNGAPGLIVSPTGKGMLWYAKRPDEVRMWQHRLNSSEDVHDLLNDILKDVIVPIPLQVDFAMNSVKTGKGTVSKMVTGLRDETDSLGRAEGSLRDRAMKSEKVSAQLDAAMLFSGASQEYFDRKEEIARRALGLIWSDSESAIKDKEQLDEFLKFFQNKFDQLKSINPSANILDIGTGNFIVFNLAHTISSKFRIYANDSAKISNHEVPSWLNFYNAPTHQLDIPNVKFDLIVSQFGMEYAQQNEGDQPEDAFLRNLRAIHRHLRKGGKLVFLMHHPRSGYLIDAWIRLHQFKFLEKSGIMRDLISYLKGNILSYERIGEDIHTFQSECDRIEAEFYAIQKEKEGRPEPVIYEKYLRILRTLLMVPPPIVERVLKHGLLEAEGIHILAEDRIRTAIFHDEQSMVRLFRKEGFKLTVEPFKDNGNIFAWKGEAVEDSKSAAMRSETEGGIDLNNARNVIQVKKEGENFKFDFDGTEIDAAQVTGATFTIRTMTPVTNLPEELGLNIEPADKSKQEILAKA